MKKNIEIIDDSEKLEQTIKRIWTRNVFFMWWYALIFLATVIRASFNRVCQIPRLIHNLYYKDHRPYIRKVSKYQWIENWNILVDSNYWKLLVMFLFFFTIALSKTLYHLGKILFFLWKHVIKPILWMLVVLSVAKTISDGLSSKNN